LKVAILGTATGWDEAPFGDDSYEIWGLNTCYRRMTPAQIRRCARWFELHGDTPLTRSRRPDDHWASLDALGMPVYTFYDLPTVTRAVKFPIDDAIAAGKDYFACTMCYQVALALSEQASHIELYGISLVTAREALVERPCLEWWLGLAEGRGVSVKVRHASRYGLFQQPYRYAYDDQDERTFAYDFVSQHHMGAMTWMLDEVKRLNLQPEPLVSAREGRLTALAEFLNA
jgi:hypothetical protein